jgi:hypothetical protein
MNLSSFNIFLLLVIFFSITKLLSDEKVDKEKDKSVPELVLNEEILRLKKILNSDEFLKEHKLSPIKNKITLTDDKSYPQEIHGWYYLTKLISKDNKVTEFPVTAPVLGVSKDKVGQPGMEDTLLNIKIEYFENVSVLNCATTGKSSPETIWLFSENVFVAASKGRLIFFKKADSKTEK